MNYWRVPTLWCVRVHTCVHVCVYTCVVTRGHQLDLVTLPYFFPHTGFFTEPAEAQYLVTLAGQQDPELSFSLPLSPEYAITLGFLFGFWGSQLRTPCLECWAISLTPRGPFIIKRSCSWVWRCPHKNPTLGRSPIRWKPARSIQWVPGSNKWAKPGEKLTCPMKKAEDFQGGRKNWIASGSATVSLYGFT